MIARSSTPRRVVILGALSTIAEALARRLAAQGAHLVLAGRNAERLQQIAADLTARGAGLARPWPVDLAAVPDPRVELASEPANVEIPWRKFTQGQSFSPKVWNDAYLAAFADSGNLEVVTFDKGFAQYPISCLLLS